MLSEPSSITKDGYACQWLGNVDIRMYAQFDQYVPYGLRIMDIFNYDHGWTDSYSDYNAHRRGVQLLSHIIFPHGT